MYVINWTSPKRRIRTILFYMDAETEEQECDISMSSSYNLLKDLTSVLCDL